MIQRDNTELAAAMMEDKEFSPRVVAAVEKSTMVKANSKRPPWSISSP